MDGLRSWLQGINFGAIRDSLMVALAAMLAISFHESSHALTAFWLGDDTAKQMKRISLNPLRHIDLIGFAMMVVARIGWAKPVPVNMYRFKNPKLGMALTAAAGPLSNILLAFLSGFGFWLTAYLFYPQFELEQGAGYWLNNFFYLSFVLNAGLAVFNLIPISPLDGSKMLAILLPAQSYEKLMRYERYGMLVLLLLVYMGVLNGPIVWLRNLLLDGISAVVEPLGRWIAGY